MLFEFTVCKFFAQVGHLRSTLMPLHRRRRVIDDANTELYLWMRSFALYPLEDYVEKCAQSKLLLLETSRWSLTRTVSNCLTGQPCHCNRMKDEAYSITNRDLWL